MNRKRFSLLNLLAQSAGILLLFFLSASLILFILTEVFNLFQPYKKQISIVYFALVALGAMLLGLRERKSILGMVLLFVGLGIIVLLVTPAFPAQTWILSILFIVVVVAMILIGRKAKS